MSANLKELLLRAGLLHTDRSVLVPLSGGVSSEIYRVEEGQRRFVVKRALAKLRVGGNWCADPARNAYEHRFMSVVGRLLPGAVPRIIHKNDEEGWFAMEWLGGEWLNWKTAMLAGVADPAIAAEAGRILGTIHHETRNSGELRREFDTLENFRALRLDAYLLATGQRHPALLDLFEAEAKRLASTRECLVHGDYSPKNMLVLGGRVTLLDCEVAWYGDPAFDLAFLLNHLHLKALFHAPHGGKFAPVCAAACEAYFAARGTGKQARMKTEGDVARLLLMLMLARVDGKSPVEYLSASAAKQDFLRRFVAARLPAGYHDLTGVSREWFRELDDLP
jgi:aminoglycoside phosphotransferase (APT) family kinase protein